MKRKIIFILILSFIFSIKVTANMKDTSNTNNNVLEVDKTISEIDEILIKANTPKEVVEKLDDELKKMIYLNSGEDIEYIEAKKEVTEKDVSLVKSSGYEIPESDLEISVVAYKNGTDQIDIYPSYKWKTPVRPKGKDYFGYSTHGDYSVVPGKRSNLLWVRRYTTQSWENAGSMSYTSSSMTGYEHQGSSLGNAGFDFYIKGNAYFRADIDDARPVNKIAIAYVHDTSSTSSFCYSISYGVASIGVVPSSTNVGYRNDVYYLNY